MLRLVGRNNFDARTARRMYQADEIRRITQGVYCDPEDYEDLPEFMRRHAIRIANYLFPETVLVGASAFFRGPVEAEGSNRGDPTYKLFIAGSYGRTVAFKHLEIVQSSAAQRPAPAVPPVEPAPSQPAVIPLKLAPVENYCHEFEDGNESVHGQLRMLCASDELIFLQNFSRKHHFHPERFLQLAELEVLRERLVAKHGEDLAPMLSKMAVRLGDYFDELGKAIEMLRTPVGRHKAAEVNYLHNHVLGWFRRPVAHYRHNQVGWEFFYKDNWLLPLEHEQRPAAAVPAYVANFLPEGYLATLINQKIKTDPTRRTTVLSLSRRYLSNVAIAENAAELGSVPRDVLAGRLSTFSAQGVFTGSADRIPEYAGKQRDLFHEVLCRPNMPRVPGAQAKMPVFIDGNGAMMPADDAPFTHLLKFPGNNGDPDQARTAVEWASMAVARAGGLKTADFALVELGDGVLAYVTERFDIPTGDDDTRLMFAEDFCSLLSLQPSGKFYANDEKVVEVLLAHSTKKQDDVEELLRLFVANYVLENADFHLKNLAFVKIAEPTLDGFRSVRLSPAFDIMNTRFFPNYELVPLEEDEREPMVFEVNGKDTDLVVADFVALGGRLGIEEAAAQQIVQKVTQSLAQAAQQQLANLPPVLDAHPLQKEYVVKTLERATQCCLHLVPDIEITTVRQPMRLVR